MRETCDEILDIGDFLDTNFCELLLYQKKIRLTKFQLALYFYLTDYDSLGLCHSGTTS